MKFTVAVLGVLCLSTAWAGKVKSDDQKGKRDAAVGIGSQKHSMHTLQIKPSLEDSSAVSIGAGYSVGAGKPTYQLGQNYHVRNLGASAEHNNLQLAPIPMQPGHGGLTNFNDLAQLMSQLTQGLNSGALTLSPAGTIQQATASQHSAPRFSYSSNLYGLPQHVHLGPGHASNTPTYATGSKGLGSYGSTGPVLFSPDSHGAPQISFSADSGHPQISGYSQFSSQPQFPGLSYVSDHSEFAPSFADSVLYNGHGPSISGYSLGVPSFNNHPFGGHSPGSFVGPAALEGHSGGPSFGRPHSSGISFASSGYTFGANPKSLGSPSGHSKTFKPSTYLGSSYGDSTLSSSGVSPSFGNLLIGHNHPSGGFNNVGLAENALEYNLGTSNKFSSYMSAKPESYGTGKPDSFPGAEPESSLSAGPEPSPVQHVYSAASSSGHSMQAGPNYFSTSKLAPSSSPTSHHSSSPSFGDSYNSGTSNHGALSNLSLAPKYSPGHISQGYSPRYSAHKDALGAYSDSTYNTIKYSEDIRPRAH